MMPYRSQGSKNQERDGLDLKKIPVMDLLNGTQFNLLGSDSPQLAA